MNETLTHKYTHDLCNKKITFIGPYPPPLGGVAVHIKRVMQKLKKQNNNVTVIDTSQKNKTKLRAILHIFKIIKKTKPDIIIYHEPFNSFARLFFITFLKVFFKFKIFLVDHNCRALYKISKRLKIFYSLLLTKCEKLIAIGHETYNAYKNNNIKTPKNFTKEAAFLPPESSDESKISNSYPKELHRFLRTHSPIIIANAFKLVLLNNQDLYGLDLCINSLTNIKKKIPDVGLIIALAHIGNQNYFHFLKEIISKNKLSKNIYFLHNQKELWPLFKKADLFVRPTLSDGYAISIQEALFFNIPVVASDVSTRPQEVTIFVTKNQKDFEEKVAKILQQRRKTNDTFSEIANSSYTTG
mgnify:FL=1